MVMYRDWSRTKNTYIATTLFLCGGDKFKIIDKFPGSAGLLKQLESLPVYDVFVHANSVRRALAANEGEVTEAIVASFVRLKERTEKVYVLSDRLSCELDECIRTATEGDPFSIYNGVYELLNWMLPAAASLYPSVLSMKIVRMALLGERNDPYTEIYRGMCNSELFCKFGYCPLDMHDVAGINSDYDLFTYLLAKQGSCEQWPGAFVAKSWLCYSTNPAQPRALDILVDGENILPCSYEQFMWTQLKVPAGYSVRVFIFVSEEERKQWLPAVARTECPCTLTVVPRVKSDKSRVDLALIQQANSAFYTEGVRQFCVVSSDSDFSILHETLEGADVRFALDFCETNKSWIATLAEKRLAYVCLDHSLLPLNKSIYMRTMVADAAEEEAESPAYDDEKWNEFLSRLGISPLWPGAASVRSYLMAKSI